METRRADHLGYGCRSIFVVSLRVAMILQTVSKAASHTSLCATLVQPWGYPCTEYTVETEDGFLLGVQNIPHGTRQPSFGAQRPPVFLQHGLFAQRGGDNWLFNGPQESLAFILADSGFDVWIGNIRGIEWSHGHVTLTTDDSDFWEWSWDELAAYDLPAMLGFVYKTTGSKVFYVGHSQGTTMMMAGLVGTAQSEALTNILAANVFICPIAYMGDITSTFDRVAADLYVDTVINVFGAQEFSLHNDLGLALLDAVCGTPGVNCMDLYRAFTGNDCCLNETRVPFYLNFYPQPTSSINLAHFGQMIRKNTFAMYDYGIFGNLKHYKQVTPPAYLLTNLPRSIPLMIVHGGMDSLADPKDVEYLVNLLGSKVTEVVTLDNYAHGDFVFSTTANVNVYPQIISFLRYPKT